MRHEAAELRVAGSAGLVDIEQAIALSIMLYTKYNILTRNILTENISINICTVIGMKIIKLV